MALVSIDNGIQHTLRLLRHCQEQCGVQIYSYKRNRFITVIKLPSDRYMVEENGYQVKSSEIDAGQLQKYLKVLFKREFPRSRKLRIIKIDDDTTATRVLKKL